MRAVEDGTIPRRTVLIVESFDRLSREEVTVALQQFLTLINDHEIEIHVVAFGRSSGIYRKGNVDSHALMMAIIEMSRAFGESERKGQLTSGAWDRLRSSGQPVGKNGGRPMGRHPSWLIWKSGGWEVIEERAAVIRRIFELAVKHRLGRYEIAVRLVREEAPYWGSGSSWTSSGVNRALDNPAVAGRLEPRRSTNPDACVIEGYYPELLPHTEYLEAQRVVSARAVGGGRTKKIHAEALLTGLTWAKGCRVHRGFAKQPGGNHQLTYIYVYENRNRYLTMGARLENMVLMGFSQMLDSDLSVDDANVKRREITESIQEFTALRNEAEQAMQSYLDAIGDSGIRGELPMPELVARLKLKQADRDQCTTRILALENQWELLPSDGVNARQRMIELKEQALDGDSDARSEVRSLLHRMVLRIDVARTDWPSWQDSFPDEVGQFGVNAIGVALRDRSLVIVIRLRNGRVIYCAELPAGGFLTLRGTEWQTVKKTKKRTS